MTSTPDLSTPRGGDDAERYALGLMVEEMGETLKLIGKALRFGLDAPGPDNAEYEGRSARQMLPTEMGDLLAAIDFAVLAKIATGAEVSNRAGSKLRRLLDPESRDAQGNRLAPEIKP